jgi:hypothetical protein
MRIQQWVAVCGAAIWPPQCDQILIHRLPIRLFTSLSVMGLWIEGLVPARKLKERVGNLPNPYMVVLQNPIAIFLRNLERKVDVRRDPLVVDLRVENIWRGSYHFVQCGRMTI